MTVQPDPAGTPASGPSGSDQSTATRVAGTAVSEASTVASDAAGGAREVAGEAGTQAKAVAGEAKLQLDRLIGQSRDEVRHQAEQRTTQAAGQLRTLSEQFGALVGGRPEAAGPLADYAGEAQDRLRQLAGRMDQGGAQGIVDDVTRFARRRPGVFLAGAAGMGFVVGRLVRAGAASQGTTGSAAGDNVPVPDGPVYGEPGTLPPPGPSLGPVQ
jgi:ElaB/YqjD/DUF883 family membrane-anchored ribosome-binding protein